MMNALLTLAISLVVVASVTVEAQFVSECGALRNELAGKRIRVFENAEGIANIVNELCVDFNEFR